MSDIFLERKDGTEIEISRYKGTDNAECEDCLSNDMDEPNLAQWVVLDREQGLYLCHMHKDIYIQEFESNL